MEKSKVKVSRFFDFFEVAENFKKTIRYTQRGDILKESSADHS
jgi:5'-deoxynucleotidase YfbR-like HD superfamily hydrolase